MKRESFKGIFAFVFLSTFYSVSSLAASFSVQWWNTGGTNAWMAQHGDWGQPCYAAPGNLERRVAAALVKTARSTTSPDVLLLGEYFPGFLDEGTRSEISKTYFYSSEFLYNEQGRPIRILALSKIQPVSQQYVSEGLRWDRLHNEAGQPKKNYLNLRSYQRLTYLVGNHEVNVVPVHAVNPWADIRAEWGSDTWFDRMGGLLDSGLQMMFSAYNPSAIQAGYLNKYLKSDRHWDSIHSTWMMIGDLNIPNQVLGVAPYAYLTYQNEMRAISLKGSTKHTFPSVECGTYPKVPHLKIDHAFVKGIYTKARGKILSDAGSDHYPIRVDLDL